MLFKTREGEGRLPYDFGQQHPVAGVAGPRPSDQAIASARPPRAATRSLIDRRLHVTGDLEGRGELHVEGKVEGNIRCALLVVGSQGMITGNVTADEVVVRGELKGTIRANSVVLQDRARVNSEIFHKLLSIEAGVCFEGLARRSSDPTHIGGVGPCLARADMDADMDDVRKAGSADGCEGRG
jgi:cytoskeletal protein CcmA (bactofilin family)